MLFSERDIKKIAEVLGVEAKPRGNNYRLVLENPEAGRRLSVEIYPNIPLGKAGKKNGSLISVYTRTAHLQLHFCTGFVVSKMLGEVTFVAEHRGKMSGLIIEKEAGCSLFANVDAQVLSGDFTNLGPEVMLTGVALSLTESLLSEGRGKKDKKAKKTTGKSRKQRS
ncbi:MAG: hypothetical protein ONB44_19615 [candidate division KSB1 bacterium]|nr:hypothetical protein [candidate division KSB1 bacterium]MDZ7304338.1 hypothetical protein [candidate division KSB1 bacterium]MDZ7313651.1 hypothetical protein [candidate division KSB1 bacterium]